MKVHGGEIQIFDMDHAGDVEYEQNQEDLRLIKVAEDLRVGQKVFKSSYDTPVTDRSVSSVPPHSETEKAGEDFLSQRPPNSEHLMIEDDGALRNYHGRLRESFAESTEKPEPVVPVEKKEEVDNFEMEISPKEVGYS